MELGAEESRRLPSSFPAASYVLPEPLLPPSPSKTVAQHALERDVLARPGGPLDNVRKNPILPRVNGLYTLHRTELDNGWSLEARAGRSRELNVNGLVAGLRYVPAPGVEVAPLELRIGRQPNSQDRLTIGARVSARF